MHPFFVYTNFTFIFNYTFSFLKWTITKEILMVGPFGPPPVSYGLTESPFTLFKTLLPPNFKSKVLAKLGLLNICKICDYDYTLPPFVMKTTLIVLCYFCCHVFWSSGYSGTGCFFVCSPPLIWQSPKPCLIWTPPPLKFSKYRNL